MLGHSMITPTAATYTSMAPALSRAAAEAAAAIGPRNGHKGPRAALRVIDGTGGQAA
ncbi:hypothetical protein GCM10020367_20490 [Streptomyces sannanensis]|uniref:Integrase n=1 Tax=Streptomyces sannanensis TaxID=285536 RepID=A0ABP6S8X2_9ACTN